MRGNVSADAKVAMRRIAVALCFSVLAHIFLLSKIGVFQYTGIKASASPLQISLPNPGKIGLEQVEPAASSIAELVMASQEASESTKSVKALDALVANRSSPGKLTELSLPSTSAAVSASLAVSESVQAERPKVIPVSGLTGVVKSVEITFEIFTGQSRQLAGVGRHSYASPDGENYGVSIDQSLGKEDESAWKIMVSGRINRQGLSPILYDVQGNMAERLVALQTVPDLSPGLPVTPRKGRMADGLLDRQSLIYQFMIRPPEIGGGKLWISDGIRHDLFSYRVATLDSLPITALGGVRAIKLQLSSSDSAETIELWLVPDMHYLPVKVRHIDRFGSVTEQEAVSLDFKE
jgi:hypothetical protein